MDERETKKVRRLSGERRLTSAMNDTKWLELRAAMLEREHPPRFRIKDLRADAPTPYWDREWFHHFAEFVAIEYVDLEPVEPSDLNALIAEIRRLRLPHTLEHSGVRIWGYVSPCTPVLTS